MDYAGGSSQSIDGYIVRSGVRLVGARGLLTPNLSYCNGSGAAWLTVSDIISLNSYGGGAGTLTLTANATLNKLEIYKLSGTQPA